MFLFLVAYLLSSQVVVHTELQCPPPVKVGSSITAPIRNISFTNDQLLSPQWEDEITTWARHRKVDPRELKKEVSVVAKYAAENSLRSLQDAGYLKAQVVGRALAIPGEPARYDIAVDVESLGPQYRLTDLTFTNATWFPVQQLRDLFPIQRGEIFSRAKVEEGLENLRHLYGSQGYLNFTPVPQTQFDDENATANLTIAVDEGKQFRFHNVEVAGLAPDLKDRVLSNIGMRPGEVFDAGALQDSIAKFHDLAVREPTLTNNLDEEHGWVNVVLDFRPPRDFSHAYGRTTASGSANN